ncbi:unnamed protein product [Spirodela intermedia]|uniref:Ribosomal protein L32 n=1 Tax=Spirodela intermedia TaxID=51605 RepID=A0ABN7EDP6_SPIIN|nr:unnamed protein product [Spirodela intermedia]
MPAKSRASQRHGWARHRSLNPWYQQTQC